MHAIVSAAPEFARPTTIAMRRALAPLIQAAEGDDGEHARDLLRTADAQINRRPAFYGNARHFLRSAAVRAGVPEEEVASVMLAAVMAGSGRKTRTAIRHGVTLELVVRGGHSASTVARRLVANVEHANGTTVAVLWAHAQIATMAVTPMTRNLSIVLPMHWGAQLARAALSMEDLRDQSEYQTGHPDDWPRVPGLYARDVYNLDEMRARDA